MVLDFIPIWLSVFLAVVGVGGLIFKNQISSMVAQVGSPLNLKARQTLLIMGVIGIVAGGGTAIVQFVSGFLPGTGEIFGEPDVVSPYDVSCKYGGYSYAVNDSSSTFRKENAQLYYLDIDNSSYFASDGVAGGGTQRNINFSILCERSGPVNVEVAPAFRVKGEIFRDELSTASSNEYNIILTGTDKSSVYPERFEQTATILDDGQYGAATTSPTEEGFLTFADGDKNLYVGVHATLDADGIDKMKIGSTKDIEVFALTNGEEKRVFRVIVNKVA